MVACDALARGVMELKRAADLIIAGCWGSGLAAPLLDLSLHLLTMDLGATVILKCEVDGGM